MKINLIICVFVLLLNLILREKFEPEPGFELRPPDLYSGALPLSYPGSYSNSPSNSRLRLFSTSTRLYDQSLYLPSIDNYAN